MYFRNTFLLFAAYLKSNAQLLIPIDFVIYKSVNESCAVQSTEPPLTASREVRFEEANETLLIIISFHLAFCSRPLTLPVLLISGLNTAAVSAATTGTYDRLWEFSSI